MEGFFLFLEVKVLRDLLLSNGWWRMNGKGRCGSDFEIDFEVSSEVENSECFDLEIKNDGFI